MHSQARRSASTRLGADTAGCMATLGDAMAAVLRMHQPQWLKPTPPRFDMVRR
jgi:hypothetical protein